MTEERRRYFRIDDNMGLSYRRLNQEEVKVFAQQAREHGANFDYAANFDNRIQTLLDACRVQNPIAAELIGLMNKKLNFVIQQLDIDAGILQKIAYELKQVNISACGLAFACDQPLRKGELLQLDILLKPEDLHVVAMAEVVACEADDAVESQQPGYFMRLDFVELNTNDQELLIQHVVKRQGALLKERRRAREN